MSKTRSYAIVAIMVAAAVLTPTPDIPTMLVMAAPMVVLYEICIWLAYFDRKKARIREEQEAREAEERRLRHEATAETTPADEAGDDGWHAAAPSHHLPISDELRPLDDEKDRPSDS